MENILTEKAKETNNMSQIIAEAQQELDEIEKQLKRVKARSVIKSTMGLSKISTKHYKNLVNDLKIFEALPNHFNLKIARSETWTCCAKIIEQSNNLISNQNLSKLVFLTEIYHPNILPIFSVQLTELNNLAIFATWPTNTFSELLKKYKKANKILEPEQISKFALEVIEPLNYLHENQIINRGINSNLIYYIEKKYGEIDKILTSTFYSCKQNDIWIVDEKNQDYFHPVYSTAPEVIVNPSSHDCSSDIWSFGILLFQLLTLREPYAFNHDFDIDSMNYDNDTVEYLLQHSPLLPDNFNVCLPDDYYPSPPSGPTIDPFDPTNPPASPPTSSPLSTPRFIQFSSSKIIDYLRYQNLVNLFLACTNTNPALRPSSKQILDSLTSSSYFLLFYFYKN